MFISFLHNSDQCRQFQEGLRSDGFPDQLLSGIEKSTADNVPGITAALFQLVAAVSRTDSLFGLVQTTAALCLLLREIPDAPTCVLNAQYAAVDAVICDSNIHVIVEHVPALVAKIDPTRPTVSEYETQIVRIIMRILAVEDGPPAVAKSDLAERFAAILRKFRVHSIAHGAISTFVVGLLDFPEIAGPFLDAIIPIAAEALNCPTVEERGFGWRFFGDLRRRDEALAARIVGPPVWDAYRAINTVAEARYGGELPKAQAGDLGTGRAAMLALVSALMQQKR
jgi:hypothetical protein